MAPASPCIAISISPPSQNFILTFFISYAMHLQHTYEYFFLWPPSSKCKNNEKSIFNPSRSKGYKLLIVYN